MTDSTINIEPSTVPKIANGFRLQFEKAQDTWVLLYPEGMVKLNPSASEILQRCDGSRTVTDIVNDLQEAFNTTDLMNDVCGFLSIAKEQHWVTLE